MIHSGYHVDRTWTKTKKIKSSPQRLGMGLFSIQDNSITTPVCNLCHKTKSLGRNESDAKDMNIHLSFKHSAIYQTLGQKKNWDSHFVKVQCSTNSTNINIQCKYCDPNSNPYNKELRIYLDGSMINHLRDEHNIEINEWRNLENWRDTNLTENYYNLIQQDYELIKRTRFCKKCGYQFRRSNLCIMLKHLIRDHRSDITFGSDSPLPLDKLRLPLDILPEE